MFGFKREFREKPYRLLIDRASVVVVFNYNFSKARIVAFDLANIAGFCSDGKIPMIVFLNEDHSVCFELGFGRTNPYSLKSPWRVLKHRPPIEITPVMWRIIGVVINQAAIRKTLVFSPYRLYDSKRAGRRFWISGKGKKLIVYNYCGRFFQRGIKLTLSKKRYQSRNSVF